MTQAKGLLLEAVSYQPQALLVEVQLMAKKIPNFEFSHEHHYSHTLIDT